MSITKWLVAFPVIGITALCPAALMAARVKDCIAAPPTPESYAWNFPKEASNLLNDMRYEARQVAYQAAELNSVSTNPDTGFYGAEAQGLTNIKADVNDMGRQLCRLEAISRVTPPWEQRTIDRVAPFVQYLADNTNDAINYMNVHQSEFWLPFYKTSVNRLYSEANTVARQLYRSEQFERQRNHQMYFGPNPPAIS